MAHHAPKPTVTMKLTINANCGIRRALCSFGIAARGLRRRAPVRMHSTIAMAIKVTSEIQMMRILKTNQHVMCQNKQMANEVGGAACGKGAHDVLDELHVLEGRGLVGAVQAHAADRLRVVDVFEPDGGPKKLTNSRP